jgi:chemotaxis protein methyltransferase CheR
VSARLTDEEYRLFAEWLAEEYGLHFGPEKRDVLRTRLEPRRAALGLSSFRELHFHLRFHPEREREREELLPHLTNNESYFLRERAQLDLMAGEVMRETTARLRREGRQEVRVLSAACAAGEEPYSVAILARERGALPAGWALRLTGLDVDRRALERARQGVYSAHAFRGVPQELRDRYFTPENDGWRIHDSIREQTSFLAGNLLEPSWRRSLPLQDVIFCRNVLIYFDEAGVQRAVRELEHALAPGGVLFLGHAESLARYETELQPVRQPGVIYYRKEEA